MLQALNEQGKLITAYLLNEEEIKRLRHQHFYCPECKEKVIIRAGPQTTPHFAHVPSSSCTLKGGGESEYHFQAKLKLFRWLQSQSFPDVELEPYLPTINQRPDLLFSYGNKQIVIEFQSATIAPSEILQRNNGYKQENIYPLWILGENQFIPSSKSNYIFQINTFQRHAITQSAKHGLATLIYFCPVRERFTLLQDIYFHRTNRTFAISRHLSLKQSHFFQLFKPFTFPKSQLYAYWYNEKKRFRLAPYRVRGKELLFRKWLYEKGIHVEQLPSTIHLPLRSQYQMNVPLWHWQSKLVLQLLHPLAIGQTVTITECERILRPYSHVALFTGENSIVEQYFSYLIKAKLFKEVRPHVWMKIREFRFHRYIEEALRADQLLMNYLLRNG